MSSAIELGVGRPYIDIYDIIEALNESGAEIFRGGPLQLARLTRIDLCTSKDIATSSLVKCFLSIGSYSRASLGTDFLYKGNLLNLQPGKGYAYQASTTVNDRSLRRLHLVTQIIASSKVIEFSDLLLIRMSEMGMRMKKTRKSREKSCGPDDEAWKLLLLQ